VATGLRSQASRDLCAAAVVMGVLDMVSVASIWQLTDEEIKGRTDERAAPAVDVHISFICN
jgi:hypothetical protein